jgi:hypothetical protein
LQTFKIGVVKSRKREKAAVEEARDATAAVGRPARVINRWSSKGEMKSTLSPETWSATDHNGTYPARDIPDM